ncbi:type 4a pilus biogenesis protein PilO [Pelotalea chapellei]|uniref:Type 4a pilus biogenesis protein PilO n=1 Tax=Pelotalea chapellei TaxID=44671 RepID=A0ABS5U465_9BACT|nr:type 4a pilus biogenesis protein PilO [Pelotalea chapellei]MBT1070449.1 type 4a pilus biogenesis protein PilO [Pelotalea chapellei]
MDPQIEKILKLPTKQKIIILLSVVILEAAGLIWFLYVPKYKEHQNLKTELSRLQSEIDEKTRLASNLPRLQKEYDQLNVELQQALTELPNSKEIPSLLTSITSLGKNAGLDFLVFRPKAESAKDFYSEVPVDISVSGSYYSVANFFAAVSNLPRIVNITNVAFADIKNLNNRTMTKVNCLATTFRFLDKKEIKDEKKPATK